MKHGRTSKELLNIYIWDVGKCGCTHTHTMGKGRKILKHNKRNKSPTGNVT
jgi:hypothetical protein